MVKSKKLPHQSKSRSQKRASRKPPNRSRLFETLERREMFASDFSPAITAMLAKMRLADYDSYQAAGTALSRGSTGGSGGSGTAGGESGNLRTVTEVEPNDIISQAQLLPLNSSQAVNYTGNFRNSFDVDYIAFDLKKGDILNTRLVGITGTQPLLGLFNSAGTELLLTQGRFLGGFPASSPIYEDGNTTLPYVIDTDGRYFMRISDGVGPYTLNLQVHRSTYETEAVGTMQTIYIDFDGSFLPRQTFPGIFTLPNGTVRVPSLARAMPLIGLTEADAPAVARNIMNRVSNKLLPWLAADSNNGFYPSTGRPGDFGVRLLSSYDSADMWGMPNVSRILVGGTFTELGIADPFVDALYGVAESVDIGNFDREETALVIAELHATQARDRQLIPISGSVTVADVFAEVIADTIAHEAGHYLGSSHQDPFNEKLTLMDQFPPPSVIGVGLDGIFGTRDDASFRFLSDDYTPLGTPFGGGVNNDPNVLAFGMSTGKAGGSITGLVYNDNNRNARQDGGEGGLAPWQVYVDSNNNGVRDAGEPGATTDSAGRYSIGVGAGTYNLRLVYPAGWIASTSSEAVKTVTVSLGATAAANFGAVFPQVGATGFKWLDVNGDGVRDANEPGLAGVYIFLDLDGDARPDIGEPATITKADGSYTLTPPQAGTYQIREVVESGYVQTFPASGFHNAVFNGTTPLAGYDFGNRESSDWGDAPAPYPTTRAQNGASHGLLPGFRLGTNWDADLNGVNSAAADNDDLNAPVDDEDGIILLNPILRGASDNLIQINVTNTASSAAFVNGWIDFNGNGVWGDPGEQIVTNLAVSAGNNIINFAAPSNAVSSTAARFRLSSVTGIGPTGRAVAGEVEDYMFNLSDGARKNLQDDSYTVIRNSVSNTFDVLANDFKPPNDPIVAVLPPLGGKSGQGGTVTTGTGNVLSYTPARGFFGRDSFKYTVVYASGIRDDNVNVDVNVVLQFVDPQAIDDSFDVDPRAQAFPLNVLLNDIEGRNGALSISNVTSPDKGGSVSIGSGGLSLRYTPPSTTFSGSERFTYTAVDGGGKSTTARVTVHSTAGRADDDVQFSFTFYDMAGKEISKVNQGEQFRVDVFTYDLRPDRSTGVMQDAGVYAAYLDLLYNSKLVMPASPGSNTALDFANTPTAPYTNGVSGSAQFPGVIQSLGAFLRDSGRPSMSTPPGYIDGQPIKFQSLIFKANTPGLAEFVGDPANQSPNTDVMLYVPANLPVPVDKVRYLRSSIEILPQGTELPFAVDDSPKALELGKTGMINVLANDIVGTSGPLRILEPRPDQQPKNGVISIDNRGTSSTSDDLIRFVPIKIDAPFTDQFTYTIADSRGYTSTGTVTIQVGDKPLTPISTQVILSLRTYDTSGMLRSNFAVGEEFELRGFVQDNTNSATGVFSAFQDILYDRSRAAVKPTKEVPSGITMTNAGAVPSGVPAGTYKYRVVYSNGNETLITEVPTASLKVARNSSIRLNNLPAVSSSSLRFTDRRIYRINLEADFPEYQFVGSIGQEATTFLDTNSSPGTRLADPKDVKFDIQFASEYPNGQSGDIIIPGLINEVGSTSFRTSLDGNEREQFRIRMRATAPTVAGQPMRITGDPADISPFHDTLLFGASGPVPFTDIAFIAADVTISNGSGGSGEGFTNPNNRFDVNNDSYVSPIDVLLLINMLNQGQGGMLGGKGGGGEGEAGGGGTYFVDVDSDGFFTPLDALHIINELNGKVLGAGGEGEGSAAPAVEIVSNRFPVAGSLIGETSLADVLAAEIGPQIAFASQSTGLSSLDGYLAGLAVAEDEEESVDEFLDDLLRVRLES